MSEDPKPSLPSIASMGGSHPDFTGGIEAAAYLHSMRGGTPDLAPLLTALAAYFQHQQATLDDLITGRWAGQGDADFIQDRSEVTAILDAIAALQQDKEQAE